MRIAKSLIGALGMAIAASAGAISWDTGSPPSIGLTAGSIYCSDSTACNTTGTGLTGSILKLSAYSTPTLNTSGTSSPVDTGNWVGAQIAMYGGGVGITNTVQTMSTTLGVPSEGTGSPQHAIDNRGVNDILVVDFGSDNWDVSSFSLGYVCRMLGATSSSTQPSCSTTYPTVDVDAWLGGSGVIDFTTVSFSGGVPTGGFTGLALNPDGVAGTGSRNNDGATANALGRYLVITGSLSGYKDAFKVSGIAADKVTPPPPPGGNNVPLPGSAPLVALGLLGVGWFSRRRLGARG